MTKTPGDVHSRYKTVISLENKNVLVRFFYKNDLCQFKSYVFKTVIHMGWRYNLIWYMFYQLIRWLFIGYKPLTY